MSAPWLAVAVAAVIPPLVLLASYAYRSLRRGSFEVVDTIKKTQADVSINQEMLTDDVHRLSGRIEELNSFMPYFIRASDDLEGVAENLRRTLASFRQLSDDQLANLAPQDPAQYSHSIKTPLSAIESAIADAEDYVSRTDSARVGSESNLTELVLGSLAGAQRAIQAIKDILQSGAGLIGGEKPEEFSISQVARQAERMSRAATKAATPVSYSDLDSLAPVRFQKSSLLIPLTVLLENAFEAATQPGDKIEIGGIYDQEANKVHLIVTNTGLPIPGSLQEILFHEQASTKGGPGRGMGLLVAQEWLTRAGGQMTLVESNDSHSCFMLTFNPMDERRLGNAGG
jgi:signal transduction histidine kinase